MIEGEHTPPKDFGAFRERLNQRFESLSPHLQRIAQHAVGKPHRLALQTVAEAASETGVQPSTLVRFAKLFGFSGFADMRLLFRQRLLQAENAWGERTREIRRKLLASDADRPAAILDAVADASAQGIEQLLVRADADALGEAARLMGDANCIHVLGRGRAQPVAGCLVRELIGLRRRCIVLDALPGTLEPQLEAMTPEDLLIAVAFEADPGPAIDAMASVRARGVPVIALTDAELGPLARHGGVNIAVPDPGIDGVSPLAPHIVLAQSLVLALGLRQARKETAGAGTA